MKFFHLSHTWQGTELIVMPRLGRVDDTSDEQDIKPFIAVCPSISQCLIALGAWYDLDTVTVWETQGNPMRATWVFDNHITDEHRFYSSQVFKNTGIKINCQSLQEDIQPLPLVGEDKTVLCHMQKTLVAFRKFYPGKP